jgi:hypothetical protein
VRQSRGQATLLAARWPNARGQPGAFLEGAAQVRGRQADARRQFAHGQGRSAFSSRAQAAATRASRRCAELAPFGVQRLQGETAASAAAGSAWNRTLRRAPGQRRATSAGSRCRSS